MHRVVGPVSVIALAALFLAGAVATAQEASPTPALDSLPAPLATWVTAWETGDVEGILAAYTDDAVLEDVALGTVARGKDEIRAYVEGQFAASSDLSIRTTSIFVAGDWAANEWTLTGTYTGQIPGLPPGAGQSITVRGAGILELEGDKIRVDREYWDAYAFLVAAGALPAPEADGTPAS